MKRTFKNRKGFTLIEMLIVVAIIVALIGIIGFTGPRLTRGSKVGSWQGDIKNLSTALMTYAKDNGDAYPAAPGAFATASVLFTTWAGTTTTLGKYLTGTATGTTTTTLMGNPFQSADTVFIGSQTTLVAPAASALTQLDGTTPSAATKPDIIIGLAAGTDGINHFTLWYLIGTTVYSVQDALNQT